MSAQKLMGWIAVAQVASSTHAWNLSMPACPCTGSTHESNPAGFPTPAQSGNTSTTPETYWTGAMSAWEVELAKAGRKVETLPPGGAITYGDAGNPQDLSNYKLFVVVEPKQPFTAAEKSAFLASVGAGSGGHGVPGLPRRQPRLHEPSTRRSPAPYCFV